MSHPLFDLARAALPSAATALALAVALAVLPASATVSTAATAAGTSPATATGIEVPHTLIRDLSILTLDTVRRDKAMQSGDVQKVQALVENQLLPHVNFKRLTASAMGRHWRAASPEQQQRLQTEFRTLLLRTYAGALTQVSDQRLAMRPMRGAADATEVIVQTQIVGRGTPIQLDYRLAKEGVNWQIYDMNVLGIWLGDQYRSSFAQAISSMGIDGLIDSLAAKNRTVARSPG
jgi:phospholipid transport system substrate-binding protein